MNLDARFQDGDDAPLRLIAQEMRDLEVLAALVQDAVFPITEMTYAKRQHRFALLLNRFRWEDSPAAKRKGRPFERVRSLLVFDTVLGVRSQNIDRGDHDAVLSLLSVGFSPKEQGGMVEIVLAGGRALSLQVEALEATLTDVSRPYRANSGQAPVHNI